MYQGLLAKKQESQISANLERRQIGEQFRILDPARLPARPFTPNRPRFYGMGVVAGFGVGLALALLLEYLDRTLRSEDDVRVAIGLPVLATVPLIQPRRAPAHDASSWRFLPRRLRPWSPLVSTPRSGW